MSTKKFWPTHKGCEIKLSSDQIQNIKAFISERLSGNGEGVFMRRMLFSQHNEINWYFTAHHFAHENPHYSQGLLDIVYPDPINPFISELQWMGA